MFLGSIVLLDFRGCSTKVEASNESDTSRGSDGGSAAGVEPAMITDIFFLEQTVFFNVYLRSILMVGVTAWSLAHCR